MYALRLRYPLVYRLTNLSYYLLERPILLFALFYQNSLSFYTYLQGGRIQRLFTTFRANYYRDNQRPLKGSLVLRLLQNIRNISIRKRNIQQLQCLLFLSLIKIVRALRHLLKLRRSRDGLCRCRKHTPYGTFVTSTAYQTQRRTFQLGQGVYIIAMSLDIVRLFEPLIILDSTLILLLFSFLL